jgi:hypothetical protein
MQVHFLSLQCSAVPLAAGFTLPPDKMLNKIYLVYLVGRGLAAQTLKFPPINHALNVFALLLRSVLVIQVSIKIAHYRVNHVCLLWDKVGRGLLFPLPQHLARLPLSRQLAASFYPIGRLRLGDFSQPFGNFPGWPARTVQDHGKVRLRNRS